MSPQRMNRAQRRAETKRMRTAPPAVRAEWERRQAFEKISRNLARTTLTADAGDVATALRDAGQRTLAARRTKT